MELGYRGGPDEVHPSKTSRTGRSLRNRARTATLVDYGLIGTCRLNDIDPEAYLRHILSVLPEWPSKKVAELLPWNVDLTNK